MYILEKILIGSEWVICLIAFWFIPKEKRRESSFIFLCTQCLTWILGLIVVEAGWVEYPVRLLSKANSTSFTFEYVFLPFLCIFFNLYYPQSEKIYKKILYYAYFLSVFSAVEFMIERYTRLLVYFQWQWYWTWISMYITIYAVRSVYKWFFRIGVSYKM